MEEEIITDNSAEEVKIKWDGAVFCLVQKHKTGLSAGTVKVFILNPQEATKVFQFIKKVGVYVS